MLFGNLYFTRKNLFPTSGEQIMEIKVLWESPHKKVQKTFTFQLIRYPRPHEWQYSYQCWRALFGPFALTWTRVHILIYMGFALYTVISIIVPVTYLSALVISSFEILGFSTYVYSLCAVSKILPPVCCVTDHWLEVLSCPYALDQISLDSRTCLYL